MKSCFRHILLILTIVLAVGVVPADEAEKILEDSTPTLDIRYRVEQVDDDGVLEKATASTIRTRLGFKTGMWNKMNAFVEMEDVRPIGADQFNSTINGKSDYAVVADPESTELNRAWIGYQPNDQMLLKLGRQRIVRDKGRLIGNVGWRQNEQTFDAITMSAKNDQGSVWGGWLARANRIFGDQHPNPVNRQFELQAFVTEVEWNSPIGKVAVIGQFLEFENAPALSHRNIGLRLLGKKKAGEKTTFNYRAQYVDQDSYKDADPDNEAEYIALTGGVTVGKWDGSLNYELLSGDGSYAFMRPLATLHAYNGWADRFLTTPADGLQDIFVALNRKIGKWSVGARYHTFDADEGTVDYGSELGFIAKLPFSKRCLALFKYADYSGDGTLPDTQKIWLSVEVKHPK